MIREDNLSKTKFISKNSSNAAGMRERSSNGEFSTSRKS